jgi:hypothetical protein
MIVGLIAGEVGDVLDVVARLGDLMCNVVRGFGDGFQPPAKVCCPPVFVIKTLLGSYPSVLGMIRRMIRISRFELRRTRKRSFRVQRSSCVDMHASGLLLQLRSSLFVVRILLRSRRIPNGLLRFQRSTVPHP